MEDYLNNLPRNLRPKLVQDYTPDPPPAPLITKD